MNQNKAVLKLFPHRRRDNVGPQNPMLGQKPSPANSEFRISSLSNRAFYEFYSRPHTTGILPAASRSAQPLAENCAGRDESAVAFGKGSRERLDLMRSAHAHGNQTRKEIRRNSQPGALRYVVNGADDLDAMIFTAGESREQHRQRLPAALEARGNNAGSDHGRLQ